MENHDVQEPQTAQPTQKVDIDDQGIRFTSESEIARSVAHRRFIDRYNRAISDRLDHAGSSGRYLDPFRCVASIEEVTLEGSWYCSTLYLNQ